MTDDLTTLPRATRGTSFVDDGTTWSGTGTCVDPDGTVWATEASCVVVTEVDLFVRTKVTDRYMTVDLVDASGIVYATSVQAFPPPAATEAQAFGDDLTARLLAAIEQRERKAVVLRRHMAETSPIIFAVPVWETNDRSSTRSTRVTTCAAAQPTAEWSLSASA